MSKFNELCLTYKEARDNHFAYRREIFELARKLVSGYLDYLEIPDTEHRFIPLDETPNPDSQYTLMGALHFDEDTYWHLGLQINIYEAPNTFPQQPILIKFLMKKINNEEFIVKLYNEDWGEKVSSKTNENEQNEQFVKIYEKLQLQIIQFFKSDTEINEESTSLFTIGYVKPTV